MDIPRQERHLYQDAMVETLAALHSLDPVDLGLGDFGRPDDYFARQLARWTRQYHADEAAGCSADMDTIGRWPACCRRRSIMIWTRLPTCKLGAVASKPM